MTDIETPAGRSETVARVISAISSGTNDGALDRDALRDALASEGQSFLDLPEVGLWLALTDVALTQPTETLEVDLTGTVPLIDLAAPADTATAVDLPPPATIDRHPEVPEPDEAETTGEAESTGADARIGRRRGNRRLARRRRIAPIVVEIEPRPGPAPVPSPTAVATSDDSSDDIGSIEAFIASALADPLVVDLGDPASVGTATVDRSEGTVAADWSPDTLTTLAALSAHLAQTLSTPLALALGDPSADHGATPGPYWPPAVAHRLDALAGFLQSLFLLPTEARVPASRQAGASNGAEPDPYWPRHLVRTGSTSTSAVTAPPSSPPRSSDDLEAALHAELDTVALVGEADLDPFAAEMEISLARLVRRVPLDRLGRIYPATLAAFLVRQTALHPDPADFDATMPVRALRRTNPVGLAFSEALVRLGKPVFREVEQRDHFDHRVRYLRRMQLHNGIGDDSIEAVVAAVLTSHWSGATSGREVAQDWLAGTATSSDIGAPALRLLTCTDHGGRLLDALLDLVRWRWLDPAPAAPPADLAPLPHRLVDHGWAWLTDAATPDAPRGDSPRPRLRIGWTTGAGPQLELPTSSTRWHLNGELLTYGSPTHTKTVELPPSRNGKWVVSVGSTRRSSPHDIRVHSASVDRIVLIFDEHGRHHHTSLPLGGATATIVAPAGSKVSGEVDRTLLVGRWVGFEQISVDLAGLDELAITQRGRAPVAVPVDRSVTPHLLRADDTSGLRIVFRGHVPPSAEVQVTVDDGRRSRSAHLSDPSITAEHGCFGLDHLVERDDDHEVTVTVARSGFEPSVQRVHLSARPRPVASLEAVDTARIHAAIAAFQRGAEGSDDAWALDPILAAASDRWIDEHGVADLGATSRWRRLAGWVPPRPGGSADHELATLFAGLLQTGDATERHDVDGPLSISGIATAIDNDAASLTAWATRHGRALTQWRTTRPALRQLEPLWARLQRTANGDVLVPLVAAGLLTFIDGPRRIDAAVRLSEALALAPELGVSAAVMALAYAQTQRSHPSSRFATLDFDLRP